MVKTLLGTREQKENKAGNMRTKAVFLGTGNTKIQKNTFREQGNTREILLRREHEGKQAADKAD